MPAVLDSVSTPTAEDMKKPVTEIVKTTPDVIKPAVNAAKALEADEPLLQENPHRFVLFPLK